MEQTASSIFNPLNNSNGEDFTATDDGNVDEVPSLFNMIRSVVLFILTFVVIVSNGFTLLVLRRMHHMKEATRVFLMSLTISDILLGWFCLLPSAVISAIGGVDQPVFVAVHSALMMYLPHNDLSSVLLVNAERYIACVYPLKYSIWVTKKRSIVVVCSVWVFCASFATVYSLVLNLGTYKNAPPVYDPRYGYCMENTVWMHPVTAIGVKIANVVIPLCLVVYIYIRLYRISAQYQARKAEIMAVSRRQNRGNDCEEDALPKANHRALITFLLVTVTVVIGWFPYSVIIIIEVYTNIRVPYQIIFISQCILYCIPWVNVLIYFIRNEQFQKAARKMFRQWVPRASTDGTLSDIDI